MARRRRHQPTHRSRRSRETRRVTRILGIETSCDETSAAVIDGAGDEVTMQSLVILSQDVHRIFGGVVPEIASRQHLTAIVPVVTRALAESGRGALLGRTRGDAAGEAFDKVAKLVGLPYRGGPHVERLAATGDPSRLRFARPMLRREQRPGDADYYDFSFSGLKTAVLNAVHAAAPDDHPHIARAFHEAIVDTRVEKTARAVEQHGRRRVVLGGGVAGNRTLVGAMRQRMQRLGAEVFAPSARIATDNAAMIARAG